MMKKIFTVIIASIFCVSTFAFTSSANQITEAYVVEYKLAVDGEALELNAPVISISGRTYCAMDEFLSILGADYEWSEDKLFLYLYTDKEIVSKELNYDNTVYNPGRGEKAEAQIITRGVNIKVNDVFMYLYTDLVDFGGIAYVEVRSVCNALGMKVEWSSDENKAKIYTDGGSMTIEAFAFLKYGMSMSEVFETIGNPDYQAGFGMMWPVYIVSGRMTVHVRSYDTVMEVFVNTLEGTEYSLDFDENGEIIIGK